MVLSKQTYLTKYVGKVNTRLTNAYKKRGNVVSKGQTLVKKYNNVFAIKNNNDTVGYLIDNTIYASKTKGDRARKSSQKWEKIGGRKSSCGCSKPNCKGCGCGEKEKIGGRKSSCGCSKPNCKGCGCGKKEKIGGRKSSCGCSKPNCKGSCSTHEEKKGGKCINPKCKCNKKCPCQKGGYKKGCECMENYARQIFN